jgi:hypothetical protein
MFADMDAEEPKVLAEMAETLPGQAEQILTILARVFAELAERETTRVAANGEERERPGSTGAEGDLRPMGVSHGKFPGGGM